MNIIKGLPPKLSKEQSKDVFCAIDLEIGNLPDGKLHHGWLGDFALMTMTLDGQNVYAITQQNQIEEALDNVQFTTWAMQNGGFDLRHLRSRAFVPARPAMGGYWDTLHVDRVNYAGYFDGFSLQDLARRWLQVRLPKDTQKEFIHWDGKLTEDQLTYGAMDAVVTWKIAQKQNKFVLPITKKFWWEVENIAFWAYLDFQPIPFDVDGWNAFAKEDEEVIRAINAKYEGVLLTSPDQVVKFLKSKNIKVKDSSADDTLIPYRDAHPDHPNIEVLNDILEHRRASKHVGSYGANWTDLAFERDGNHYILPFYDINKASTGRPQAHDPGIQLMPVREEPRYRTYVRANKGYKLVAGDWEQQELAIVAFMSQDSRMIQIFKNGGDIYVQAAEFQLPGQIIDKKIRSRFKDTLLGINYGQTVSGLAEKWKEDKEKTNLFYMEFQKNFPELFSYLREQEKRREYVETILGRRFWLNDHSWQARNHKRNAPVQGSASDMKKIAIGQMWLHWNETFPFPVCLDMHDEIVMHSPQSYAQRSADLLSKYANMASERLCPGVPVRMTPKIVDRWIDAKEK